MMGQILTTFFPNREKPAIRPISTREKPLKWLPVNLRMHTVMMVTAAALISAAPDQQILHQDDPVQAGQDVFRSIQQEAKQGQGQGECDGCGKDLVIPVLQKGPPFPVRTPGTTASNVVSVRFF